MERGDIYLVSLDPTIGHEQQGKRPVLVISPGRFNRLTGVPVVLPIATVGNFARTAGFAVSLMGAGTQTTGVVRCDQPRALVIAHPVFSRGLSSRVNRTAWRAPMVRRLAVSRTDRMLA